MLKLFIRNSAKITICSVTKLDTIIRHFNCISQFLAVFFCFVFFFRLEFSLKRSFQFPLLYRAWNFGWLNFLERDKCSRQSVVGKQRNWQWIFPQNDTFFVRTGQNIQVLSIDGTRDLSLLTLFLTNLLA